MISRQSLISQNLPRTPMEVVLDMNDIASPEIKDYHSRYPGCNTPVMKHEDHKRVEESK